MLFRSFEGHGETIVITRQADGGVAAFHNVCMHRGPSFVTELKGCKARRFTCPYHGWVYDTTGKLVGVPETHHEISQLEAAAPGTEVHPAKAWKEMIHRYLAGTLGLLIAALAWLSFFPQRRRNAWAHLALVGLVGIQATLGMLTVTWLLKPAIVTLHLLGGMLILATLIGIRANRHPNPSTRDYPTGLRLAAWLVAALVLTQIALGGWTSSNYAAMACVDYPLCRGELMPSTMD